MRTIKNSVKLFESEGIEIYPDENGELSAKAIVNQTVSSKVQNKMNSYDTKKFIREPSPLKMKTTNAVIKDLKSKGRLKDISKEFNINPRPDLTFSGSGDVVVTPDNGKPSFRIPGEEVDEFMENRNNSKKRVKEARSFPREGDQGRGDYLADLARALEDIQYPTTRDEEGRVLVETDVGDFSIDYIDGEWLYVISFTGFDTEFTIYRSYSNEVIEVVENTVENEVDAYLEEYYQESNPPFGGDPIEIEPNYGYGEEEAPEHDMGELYGLPYGSTAEDALKYFESTLPKGKKLTESSLTRARVEKVLDNEGIDYESGSQCVSCPIITANDIGWSNIQKVKAFFEKKGLDFGFATPDGLYYYGWLHLDDEDAQSKLDSYEDGKDDCDDDWSDIDADILVCWY